MTADRFVLAIDIGGTFTDLVLLNSLTGTMAVAKVLTSYPDPSQGVLKGVAELLVERAVPPAQIERVIHGTTLVTNTLIERKGARTALITTEGFRDALEIGREGRYDLYDLFLVLPEPLVERRLRFEASERMDVHGQVLRPLDEAAVREICRQLQAEAIEAVAVVLLHAYANPAHEEQVGAILRELLPQATVSLSHQVASELREYERTSTTVANAYVQPLAANYLHRLETGLRELGLSGPLHIMLSNGGTCAVDTAMAFPVRLVESGPCGGALAAAYWGSRSGFDHILAFDMGGTTAKAIFGSKAHFPITTESEVARVYRFKRGSGLPLLVPVMDMIEIGAGGGSIAHLNALQLPAVGPESAGAAPGPACYSLGGSQPTVTDADLLLGYLNPDYFLGGQMTLDYDQATQAVSELAQQLDLAPLRMARGIQQLVNENMAAAVRVHAAERGLDLRRYTLVATGGAGPVHACGVARRLGLKRVLVPPAAGVGSAFGLLLAAIAFDFARSYVIRLEQLDLVYLNDLLDGLESQGREIVAAAGVKADEISVVRAADMRYVGQGHEIRVAVAADRLNENAVSILQAAFEQAYLQLYGRLCAGVPIEAIHWRVTVSGPRPTWGQVQRSDRQPSDLANVAAAERQACFKSDHIPEATPVYNRYRLPPGFVTTGPAIIEEAESTTIVPPGWQARVDATGCLVLDDQS